MNNRYLGSIGNDNYKSEFDFGVLTGSYSTLDVLTSGNIPAYTGRTGQSSGVIEAIYFKIINAVPVGSMYIFGAPIDPPAQNAPRDFTAEQMDKFIGLITLSSNEYRSTSDGYVVYKTINMPYVTQPDSNALYIVFVISQADGYFATSKVTGHFILKRD
jgi:hypothetical protein